MQVKVDDQLYNVVIDKKRSNKNTYIRVKEDLRIYVTTNYYTKDEYIATLLKENLSSIKRMINKQIKRKTASENFYYLGKKYDIVYTNGQDLIYGFR